MTAGLAEEARELLTDIRSAGYPPSESVTLQESRQLLEEKISERAEGAPVHSIRDITIDGQRGEIPIRIYRPGSDEDLPILVYLHGGGWVRGSLETHDPLCRHLAVESNCLILSVDYHQPPEYRFPHALQDAYSALTWAGEYGGSVGGDPDRLVVGGDSAGGNLAAAVALLARERGSPSIEYQVLLYPTVANIAVTDFDSYYEFDGNSSLYSRGRESMEKSREQYFASDIDWYNQYAHPLHAADLGGLPPALVLSCHFDVLRDENEAYADKLEAHGVTVDRLHYERMFHPFLCFTQLTEAKRAVADIGETLKNRLTSR